MSKGNIVMSKSRPLTPRRKIEHMEMAIREAKSLMKLADKDSLTPKADIMIYEGMIKMYQIEMEKWKNHVDIKEL
jgi:hypothetical protein